MKLTIVGCGMASPDRDRVCSGFYIEGHGLKMLLDCGPGVVHRMANVGLDWLGITHLCITHFHNDHIGDVPALFFAWKWGTYPGRKQPLTVLGPQGTKHKLKQMAAAMGDHLDQTDFEVTVDELLPSDKRLLGDVVHFTCVKTPHTPESLAYRIDAPGASIGYTGDTGESSDVAQFFQNVGVLIMECSLPDAHAMPTHLTPGSAARMAIIAQPRRLAITHVYPQLDRALLQRLLRDAGWDGNTVIVHDGLQVEATLA